MNWQAILDFADRTLFHVGQQAIKISTLIELVLVVLGSLLAGRLTSTALRSRVLARTSLDPGQQYSIARIFGYLVVVVGLILFARRTPSPVALASPTRS